MWPIPKSEIKLTTVCYRSSIIIIIVVIIIIWCWDEAQGLMNTRQVLYHWTTQSVLFSI